MSQDPEVIAVPKDLSALRFKAGKRLFPLQQRLYAKLAAWIRDSKLELLKQGNQVELPKGCEELNTVDIKRLREPVDDAESQNVDDDQAELEPVMDDARESAVIVRFGCFSPSDPSHLVQEVEIKGKGTLSDLCEAIECRWCLENQSKNHAFVLKKVISHEFAQERLDVVSCASCAILVRWHNADRGANQLVCKLPGTMDKMLCCRQAEHTRH